MNKTDDSHTDSKNIEGKALRYFEEYLEDSKTHIEEGLRGCTADTLYVDDAWHDSVEFPPKSNEDCSEVTEEQLKNFAEFTKDLMKKYPVKFYTATYIERKKGNDI